MAEVQKGHPVCKNWVMKCWHGYLSGARCRWFAYGPADATATPSSLASWKSRSVLPFMLPISKYQPPSHAAYQTVYYWQPCLSSCRSSSLERSARGRRLIVIIADFPQSTENSSFSTFIPSPDFWLFDWHSGPCSNVRYLGHSKICLLTYFYLLT